MVGFVRGRARHASPGELTASTERQDSWDEDLTREQIQANKWAEDGWTQIWIPTTTNPGGRRRRYWARRGANGLVCLFPGIVGPPNPESAPHFYLNGGQVYRDEGHPDGASSVPYYALRASRVYPSEGYPSGPSDAVHFRVKAIRSTGRSATIRRTPPGE